MIGFIEFKEDVHHENIKLAHRIKEEVCELIDKLSKGEYGDRRHEPYEFDERRGGGRMNRREPMRQSDDYGDRRYILDTEPSHRVSHQYPYEHERHQSHHFDDRYNY